MATYRIGIGSFNLKDGAVGIGTESSGLGNLKVEGTIKTTDLDVGVSTFTRYSGFEGEQTNIIRDQTLSGEYSTTGDIVVDTGKTLTVGLGSTACIGSVECISVKHHFSVPVGDTAGRNKSSGYAEGTVRYNRDLGTMEFFNGNEWRQFRYQSDAQRSPSNRGRGVFGGRGPLYTMDYINIASTGNTMYFGDFSTASGGGGSSSGNETRGIFAGHGPNFRHMQYITFASEGRTVAFGEGSFNSSPNASTTVCNSNSTRMLRMGDYVWINSIDYVQIHTVGDATDFGDLSQKRAQGDGFSSTTRAMYCGGYRQTSPGGNHHVSDIEFVKFSNLGNGVNFGDLIKARKIPGASAGNSVRGIVGGGYNPSSGGLVDFIEYITLASEGNGIDFGNLNDYRRSSGCVSNQTRAVWRGGENNDNDVNSIEYIQIATGGNAQDFGDIAGSLTLKQRGCSDSHGGLGGF